ncbi:hypothetical protein ABLE68_20215 [Nocardioides sp. CN2-186]|uniref:hypothetical protein n=1 Tax=Nocardioides tweenelious TaxID=3156607 RepID=UPI0032B55748
MTEESTAFDAEAFFARMEQNRLELEMVVARRPTASDLADSIKTITGLVYETIDTLRKIAALELGLDPDATSQWFPRAGTQGASDFDDMEPLVAAFVESAEPASTHWLETNPTRNPAAWSLAYLKRCFHTVIDDFVGIGRLVDSEDHIRAPITLARSVLEAAAMGCFLLDTSVDVRERTRRTLNLHFAELKESSNAGVSRGEDRAADTQIDELTAFANTLGFVVKYRRDRHYPPIILAPGQRQPDSTRLVLDEVLPNGLGRAMWRSLSAVAHSRASHSLLPDEYLLPHTVIAWQRTKAAAWHTMPAFYVVKELCQRIDSALGWELDSTIEALDVVGVQWAIGAGLYDAQIRLDLGLDPLN